VLSRATLNYNIVLYVHPQPYAAADAADAEALAMMMMMTFVVYCAHGDVTSRRLVQSLPGLLSLSITCYSGYQLVLAYVRSAELLQPST